MLGDFPPPKVSAEDYFFFFLFFSICNLVPNFWNPAVVKSFALGFLVKPFDRYLANTAHSDVKAVGKCQLLSVGSAAQRSE